MKPTDPEMQAMFIRGHLKVMNLGMTNSVFSKRKMLDFASKLTGKTYKNSKPDTLRAIEDLSEIMGGSYAKR